MRTDVFSSSSRDHYFVLSIKLHYEWTWRIKKYGLGNYAGSRISCQGERRGVESGAVQTQVIFGQQGIFIKHKIKVLSIGKDYIYFSCI